MVSASLGLAAKGLSYSQTLIHLRASGFSISHPVVASKWTFMEAKLPWGPATNTSTGPLTNTRRITPPQGLWRFINPAPLSGRAFPGEWHTHFLLASPGPKVIMLWTFSGPHCRGSLFFSPSRPGRREGVTPLKSSFFPFLKLRALIWPCSGSKSGGSHLLSAEH